MNIEQIQENLYQLKKSSKAAIKIAEDKAEEELNKIRIDIIAKTNCLEGAIFKLQDLRNWIGEESTIALICIDSNSIKKVTDLIKTGDFECVSYSDDVDLYANPSSLFLRIPISLLKQYVEMFGISISTEDSEFIIKSMQRQIDALNEIHESCEGHIVG